MASRKKNLQGARPKLQRIMKILLRYDPVNFGEMNTPRGSPSEVLVERLTDYMVSRHLFNYLLGQVKSGKATPEEAAEEVAKQCVCGIFNPKRAAELIRKTLAQTKSDPRICVREDPKEEL